MEPFLKPEFVITGILLIGAIVTMIARRLSRLENKPYKRITIARPKNRSLEAYKAWMMDLSEQFTTEKTDIQWTEEEWIVKWKRFWKEKPYS